MPAKRAFLQLFAERYIHFAADISQGKFKSKNFCSTKSRWETVQPDGSSVYACRICPFNGTSDGYSGHRCRDQHKQYCILWDAAAQIIHGSDQVDIKRLFAEHDYVCRQDSSTQEWHHGKPEKTSKLKNLTDDTIMLLCLICTPDFDIFIARDQLEEVISFVFLSTVTRRKITR